MTADIFFVGGNTNNKQLHFFALVGLQNNNGKDVHAKPQTESDRIYGGNDASLPRNLPAKSLFLRQCCTHFVRTFVRNRAEATGEGKSHAQNIFLFKLF